MDNCHSLTKFCQIHKHNCIIVVVLGWYDLGVRVVHVALAVIGYGERYLLAYRDKHLHQGGCLEFVGGKVESGETPQLAMVREVQEELGLDISKQSLQFMGKTCHDYADKRVCLWVYRVNLSQACYEQLRHQHVGQQGQALFWYDKQSLLAMGDKLPKANSEILAWMDD